MANSLTHTRIDVQKRSGYDKSFKNILTTKVGTITPLAYKLLIPNSDFNLSLAISASLPPLASDTFMRCQLKVEAFAVPMRLLYGGFTSWLTGEEAFTVIRDDVTRLNKYDGYRAKLPRVWLKRNTEGEGDFDDLSVTGPGTLADYLGLRGPLDPEGEQEQNMYINAFPFLCYHRIYDDWYRNRKVQKPLFGRIPAAFGLANLPYGTYDSLYPLRLNPSELTADQQFPYQFIDGSCLGDLRQRNYGSDYFTESYPTATFGSEQKVTIDSSDQFTISALRIANAMETFELKNNIASPALQDYCLVNYGAHLKDGIAQRAVYLGSAAYDVYSKGVTAAADSTPTNNPFSSVGARYGNAFASGSDFVVKGHVDEPCYLMVLATLVPEANYSTGLKHDLMIFTEDGSLMDMPNPAFELVGNEPVFSSELGTDQINSGDYKGLVFGWQKRYMWHKTSINEVHGLLRDGESLASFVAQRALKSAVLGSEFLKIGTDDLDNVTAVTGDLSNYGCWIDSFIKLHVVEPLGESSLPSLVDPAAEHGDSIYIRNNGSRIV